MIGSARQYEVTQQRILEFEDALAHAEDRAAERHPLYQQVLRKNLEDELHTMYDELAVYERRTGGASGEALVENSDLPTALIRARIRAGLRQADVADRLSVTEETMREIEARRYDGVAPELLHGIAETLGVHLPDPTAPSGNSSQPRHHQPA